jgi:PAS domain S-box-containing protein
VRSALDQYDLEPGAMVEPLANTSIEAGEAATRLLVQHERLRAMIEALSEGFVYQDTASVIHVSNPAAERILGLTADQLAGRTSLDPRWRAVREDGSPFPGHEHPSMQVLASGRPVKDVVMGVHLPDGRLNWIAINAQPVFEPGGARVDGVICTFREITAERQSAEELRRNRAMLDTVLENLPLGFYVIDERSERVLALNHRFCALFGLESLEARLRDGGVGNLEVFERVRGVVADPDAFVAASRALRQPDALELSEFEFATRDGRTLRRISKRLFAARGVYVGRLFLFQDITRDIAAEEERRTAERRMEEVRRLESLGVLAGGIAHDFNNLLTSIVGNAELAALDAGDASPLRRQMERVSAAATQASELCRKLQSYAGTEQVVVRRLHLSDLVHAALRWLQPQITTRVALQEALAVDLPSVLGDQNQLNQVVVNLVLNACEAQEERGGRVRVSTGVARRDARYFAGTVLAPDLPEGEYVHLEVADDGPGIEPAVVARMFDPFFSTKFAGRGLGLSAVLGIVRMHLGALSVESTSGAGTTVRVVLPAQVEA